jgi:hypothetical protein
VKPTTLTDRRTCTFGSPLVSVCAGHRPVFTLINYTVYSEVVGVGVWLPIRPCRAPKRFLSLSSTQCNHMVNLSKGLVEKDVLVYLCGIIRGVGDDRPPWVPGRGFLSVAFGLIQVCL